MRSISRCTQSRPIEGTIFNLGYTLGNNYVCKEGTAIEGIVGNLFRSFRNDGNSILYFKISHNVNVFKYYFLRFVTISLGPRDMVSL